MTTAPANPPRALDIPAEVDHLLRTALRRAASDMHIEPTAGGCEVRYRIDGLLETVATLDAETGRGVVTRLMVLAQLLTYRHDVPQEGRLIFVLTDADQREQDRLVTLRVSIMPTTHGLRAAVRLPAELSQPRTLEALDLPPAALAGLTRFAQSDSGMLLLTGPAGSGKTTTIYALLEHIARTSQGTSIIALEDPVERDLPGVTQIQVSPFGELTYAKALRSIVRQDPQVLMLGEIRDRDTASIAVQAALSGHRLISTLHAGSCGGAIARLIEMGLEPYQITSALFAVVSQRLLRRRTPDGLYQGRWPAAQIATLGEAARRAILARSDAAAIETGLRAEPGHITMHQVVCEAVRRGVTDAAEVKRVTGLDIDG